MRACDAGVEMLRRGLSRQAKVGEIECAEKRDVAILISDRRIGGGCGGCAVGTDHTAFVREVVYPARLSEDRRIGIQCVSIPCIRTSIKQGRGKKKAVTALITGGQGFIYQSCGGRSC